MLNLRRLSALILFSLSLSSCGMPVGLSGNNGAAILASALGQYNFEVTAGFQVASVDTADQNVIDTAKSTFEADLRAGRTTAYQKDKNFSIHLLSGSEGNYFTSPEFLQTSVTQVLATLVVMQNGTDAQIFKGQFENSRFVFADPGQQFGLSTRTKAYLLTADSSFKIQTYKGELVPDSEVSSASDSTATAGTLPATEVAATATDPAATSANTVLPDAIPLYGPPLESSYNGVNMAYGADLPPMAPGQAFAGMYADGWNDTLNDTRGSFSRGGITPAGLAASGPTRAWSQPIPQGMQAARGNATQPGYDPFRNQAGQRALPMINGKAVVMAVPAVPGKFMERSPSGNPMDPNNKARFQDGGWVDAQGQFHIPAPNNQALVQDGGWIDAQGKFHPADEGFGFSKVAEPRKQEVQVLRNERRSKAQVPAYPGPETP